MALPACGPTYEVRQPAPAPRTPIAAGPVAARSAATVTADFRAAAPRIEQTAEAMCRETHPYAPPQFCNFVLRLVDDPRIGPNAFQTLGEDGRPQVVMTLQLAMLSQNIDEIAFVLGHETGHHIADHIAKGQSQAMTGALVLGTLATLGNASEQTVSDMMRIGASLGGRAYSQSYEIEADTLGAYIAARIILSDDSTLEVIPNIRRVYPDLNILVFSMQPAEIYGEALKQYGINSYQSKSAGDEEMMLMLQKFLLNEAPLRRNDIHHHDIPFKTLAPRELEILHYVLKGIGTKEISETLNLKMNTVSTIKTRIYEKTNAGNIKELIELATLYNVNY